MIWDFLEIMIKFIKLIIWKIPIKIIRTFFSLYETIFISRKRRINRSVYAKYFDRRKRKMN